MAAMPVDLVLIRSALMADPVGNVYMLADLQPQYAPACRWHVQRQNEAIAVLLIYLGLEPPIILATGPEHLIADALNAADLPPALYMNVSESVCDLLRHYYDFGDDIRYMSRMVLHYPRASGDFTGGEPADSAGHRPWWGDALDAQLLAQGFRLVSLTTADVARLEQLYAHGGDFTPDGFAAYQLEDGTFFGIETAAGELVATGGTHVVDITSRIAAVGNMYTQPQWRGRGLAKAVLGAIVAELYRRDIAHIVLNVDQRNNIARRLYEQMGFHVHCEYVEGNGVRHADPN
ncbi:MAG: GNAT family N-acetyltransferase [Litorilinea sp.]